MFAFVERHVRDALEQVGVVLESADMGPGDLVGAVAEVIVAQRLEPREHRVDLRLLDTNAASASSFDLMICFRGRALIFDLQLDRWPDECFFGQP